MQFTALFALVAMATYTGASVLPSSSSSSSSYKKKTPLVDLTEAAILDAAAKPVNVTLYFETYCGGCQYFIKTQLPKAVEVFGDDGTYMDFHFIPYGNTREKYDSSTKKWDFNCQFGPAGCQGNEVLTCAIHYKPKFQDHYKFVSCFDENYTDPSGLWKPVLKKCGKQHGMPVDEISSCVTSDLGNQLEHQMALRTGDHMWVPWVILDGVHDPDARTDLVGRVCERYSGTKPKGCPPP